MPGAYRQIVLTGGPCAGKTAVLEIMKSHHYPNVYVVPEAATIAYRGGFPRAADEAARRIAQVAIYGLQLQLEAFVRSRPGIRSALCDRGTLDGLAYWPGDVDSFFAALGTTKEKELARYYAVIQLHTPKDGVGYNHRNRERIETPAEAVLIDGRISEVWSAHPRRFNINASANFMQKATEAISLIHAQLSNEPDERRLPEKVL